MPLRLRAPKRLECYTEALATVIAMRKEAAHIWSVGQTGAAVPAQTGLGMGR